MQKPSIPKGTRDFTPAEMVRREYIFNTIRTVFKKYGYEPIETPAMENLSTLLGKYGEEGDRLLFKILNSGDFLEGLGKNDLTGGEAGKLSLLISEKGLRYDLTVPFARFVVQHRDEINFPFKRYQIQPVWRADRPQKGRYREFYQCDADIIGSNSLLNELELIQIIGEVFDKLKIPVTVKVNNRKILAGIAEIIGYPDRLIDITSALDKIEKIGKEGFIKELQLKNISDRSIKELCSYIFASGLNIISPDFTNDQKLGLLKSWLLDSFIGSSGTEEIEKLLNLASTFQGQMKIQLDFTLARGLNYYTGTIIEVKASHVEMGSLCGGGRYDDLTGIFGMPGISGVGISFGADRIYDVMNQLNLFPEELLSVLQVMMVNFGEKEQLHCLQLLKTFRDAGIRAELYPEPSKLKKQLAYANNREIPFVLLVGEKEIESDRYTLKNMQTGEQELLSSSELISRFK